MKSKREFMNTTFCFHILKIRLKRSWQQRLSQRDPFYVTLADTILKDVCRTDRNIKFFHSNIDLNSFSFLNVFHFRKKINIIQYNDDL